MLTSATWSHYSSDIVFPALNIVEVSYVVSICNELILDFSLLFCISAYIF